MACKTLLVADEPADRDYFANELELGGHHRVATAIGDLVESGEPGGKMIALEGSWGAGKSTVVRLLASRFEKTESTKVLVFDAWAHEGDPLRRTFLETIVRQLQQLNWVVPEPWARQLEEMARRRKEQTTTTTPKPTWLGTAVAVSALLVPIGNVFVTAILRDHKDKLDWVGSPYWPLIIALLALFAPLCVLFGNLIYLAIRYLGKWSAPTSPWAMLLSDSIRETTTKTIETADPTSIEFENSFTALMSEALEAGKTRRLILVLDNLDRVSAEAAHTIWSTLQTFLHARKYEHDTWFRNLWILVPYDRKGLSNLWAGEGNGTQVADSFLDKSFQIRFHVAPPVLSDWKRYLTFLLAQAFPSHHNPEHFHDVYRVYSHFRDNPQKPPTPRTLKLFVNQIGAAHRIWSDEYPLSHYAYYALTRSTHDNYDETLLSGAVPSEDAVRMLGEEIKQNVAALFFNVPSRKGLELLLTEPISAALHEYNPLELRNMFGKHTSGFRTVLEKVITERYHSYSDKGLSDVCKCLALSDVLAEDGSSESQTIRRLIKRRSLEITEWIVLPGHESELLHALDIILDDDFGASLLLSISRHLKLVKGNTITTEISATERVRTLCSFRHEMLHRGRVTDDTPQLIIRASESDWKEVCKVLVEVDPLGRSWRSFSPNPPEVIEQGLLSLANDQTHEDAAVFSVAIKRRDPIKWAVVLQGFEAIRGVPPKGTPTIDAQASELFELHAAGIDDATVLLKTLMQDGQWYHHIHLDVLDLDEELAAEKAFTLLQFIENTTPPVALGSAASGWEWLLQQLANPSEKVTQTFAALTRKFSMYGWLHEVDRIYPTDGGLVQSCMRILVADELADEVYLTDVVVDDVAFVRRAIGDEGVFESTLKRLAASHSIAARITTMSSSSNDAGFELNDLMLRHSDSNRELFISWSVEKLTRLDSSLWEAAAEAGLWPFQTLLTLRSKGRGVPLGTPFIDGLLAVARRALFKGATIPSHLVTAWGQLFESLGDGSLRLAFRERLAAIASDSAGVDYSTFLQMYGAELTSAAEKLALHNSSVSHMFTSILKRIDPAEIGWLKDFFQANPRFLDLIEATHFADEFRERLISVIAEVERGGDVHRDLLEIATTLSLEVSSFGMAREEAEE